MKDYKKMSLVSQEILAFGGIKGHDSATNSNGSIKIIYGRDEANVENVQNWRIQGKGYNSYNISIGLKISKIRFFKCENISGIIQGIAHY